MRILFDNSTPRQLRRRLIGNVVEEARERGWDGLSNGDLLDRAEEAGFEVLITTDQGIQHQQSIGSEGGCGRPNEHLLASICEEDGGGSGSTSRDPARRSQDGLNVDGG